MQGMSRRRIVVTKKLPKNILKLVTWLRYQQGRILSCASSPIAQGPKSGPGPII
nr:hypothetical protein Iba_chr05aCG10150 [Ipomoea batatas]